MPTIDLIVTAVWVGTLSLALVGQAAWILVRHRFARRQAEGAARLADAIAFPPGGRDGLAARTGTTARPVAAHRPGVEAR